VSVPVLVWLAVGLATSVLLVALVAGLVRQVRGLAATAKRLQEEVDPVAAELRREADRASARVARIQRDGVRTPRSHGDADGRS
jgi:hypothetical protein